MKREGKLKLIYECRCDERLKTQAEESTLLAYTGLIEELEHLDFAHGDEIVVRKGRIPKSGAVYGSWQDWKVEGA